MSNPRFHRHTPEDLAKLGLPVTTSDSTGEAPGSARYLSGIQRRLDSWGLGDVCDPERTAHLDLSEHGAGFTAEEYGSD